MRTWIKVTIAVAVLAGLLVGADRIAVVVAEGQAADKLAGRQGITGKPSVSIDDFPFLTDLISRKVDSVHLSGGGVQLSGGTQNVELQDFSADLKGVRIGGDDKSATIDSGTGTGKVSYQQVQSLLALQPGTSIGYGGPGLLKVSGEVFGRKLSTDVKLTTQGNTVHVDTTGALSGLAALPGVSQMIDSKFGPRDFTLQGQMPVGLQLEQVTPEPDGLALTFQGTNMHLAG
ncbi:LmeA family phospholipid-binding protein [Kitasatospora sp. LaBMicrA B282]|uniref:LmeA family phospholipid-binding protein n=1 Tax=Kitasatospora sp. LaBMicrA B282 TaxID=3420949 RepID=UPI003D12E846